MTQLGTYAFANAKIRAMLSYLISPALFSRLLEAKDIHEIVEILRETSYRDLVERVSGRLDDPIYLEREFLKNDIQIHRKACLAFHTEREKRIVALLMERYELEELKVALRIWHKKIPVEVDDYLLGERVNHDIDFKRLVRLGTIEEIILLLDATPYKIPLMRTRERYKERHSSFYLEASLDFDYYERLAALIGTFASPDRAVAQKILGVEVDIENINWLIRLRKYYAVGMGEMLEWFIPGGLRIHKDTVRSFYATDGLTKVVDGVALGPYAKIRDLIESNVYFIENFLYEILLREVRKALAGFPFTIGTILGYLVLKRKETMNIISLMYAKGYGWKKESIAPLIGL